MISRNDQFTAPSGYAVFNKEAALGFSTARGKGFAHARLHALQMLPQGIVSHLLDGFGPGRPFLFCRR